MIDSSHPNWTATIPSYCLGVFSNEEFIPGHMIKLSERDIKEHEWATGDALDSKEDVVAVIPVPDYPCDVYLDKETGDYLVARPGDEPFARQDQLELLRTTP